jgi:hypothetical protein
MAGSSGKITFLPSRISPVIRRWAPLPCAKLTLGIDPKRTVPWVGGRLYDKVAQAKADKLFDLALAHELYSALIGPVEALVEDKPHLMIVPSGALTTLPFHLLVTEQPAAACRSRCRAIATRRGSSSGRPSPCCRRSRA